MNPALENSYRSIIHTRDTHLDSRETFPKVPQQQLSEISVLVKPLSKTQDWMLISNLRRNLGKVHQKISYSQKLFSVKKGNFI